jgi:general secretion pathway protein D
VLVGGPQNLIPQTQTREMESILKIDDGQIAVLGGLMQDNINNQTDSVPILGSIPLIGSLFQYKNDTTTKTELVIFLKPTIIKNASIDDDYSTFRNTLPDDKFLTPEAQKESSAFKP